MSALSSIPWTTLYSQNLKAESTFRGSLFLDLKRLLENDTSYITYLTSTTVFDGVQNKNCGSNCSGTCYLTCTGYCFSGCSGNCTGRCIATCVDFCKTTCEKTNSSTVWGR